MSDHPVRVPCPACNQPVSDLKGHLKERTEYGDQSHMRAYSRLLDEEDGRTPAAAASPATPPAPVEPATPAPAAHEPPVLPTQPATTGTAPVAATANVTSPASPESGNTAPAKQPE